MQRMRSANLSDSSRRNANSSRRTSKKIRRTRATGTSTAPSVECMERTSTMELTQWPARSVTCGSIARAMASPQSRPSVKTLSSSAIRARKRKKTQRSRRFLLSNSTSGRVTVLNHNEAKLDQRHRAVHETVGYHLTFSDSLMVLLWLPSNSNHSRRPTILVLSTALQCRLSKRTIHLTSKMRNPDLHNLNGMEAHCRHRAGLHQIMPVHPHQ